MLTIELVGAPGAGKSTMIAAVVAGCEQAGYRPRTMDDVVPEAMARTWTGRVIMALVPARWEGKAAWRLFRAQRLVHALMFLIGRPRLLRHVLGSQRNRPEDSDSRSRKVLHWYIRHCGGWRVLSRRLDDNEVLVVDEGFVHRAVQLHTSTAERLSPEAAGRYCSLIPLPDLLVHVSADAATSHERLVDRGVWSRWDHRSAAEVERFVLHAHEAAELVVGEVERGGGVVVHIDNGSVGPERAARGLAAQVAGSLGRVRPAVDPHELPHVEVPRLVVPRMGAVREHILALTKPGRLDNTEVGEVLARYGLEAVGDPRNVAVGWRNPIVVVATDRGEKIVKRYPDRFHRCALEHEHSIVSRLADEAFPAVRLEAATDGSTLTGINDFFYGVFDFVAGRSLTGCHLPTSVSRAAIHQSGRLLAMFHGALVDFRPAGAHHLGIDSLSGRPRRDLGWHLDRLADLNDDSLHPAGDSCPHETDLNRASEAIADRLAVLDEALAGSDLPTTVVHGDFGLHNILVTPDGSMILHDFELSRRERRLLDLVTSGRRLPGRQLGWFLSGYSEVCRVTTEEWACLDLVAEEYWLRGAVQSWSNHRLHGGAERLRTATGRLELADAARRGGWRVR